MKNILLSLALFVFVLQYPKPLPPVDHSGAGNEIVKFKNSLIY